LRVINILEHLVVVVVVVAVIRFAYSINRKYNKKKEEEKTFIAACLFSLWLCFNPILLHINAAAFEERKKRNMRRSSS
jgi:hypothetical protein